jgi:NAD(P)-dependent dehydrogenase (short-subunit alcohol dehydrogenase family)
MKDRPAMSVCALKPPGRKASMTLDGKTLFVSGGSRGIGLAIAMRAARDGANVVLIAKTAEPHPTLEGDGVHRGRADRGSRRPGTAGGR